MAIRLNGRNGGGGAPKQTPFWANSTAYHSASARRRLHANYTAECYSTERRETAAVGQPGPCFDPYPLPAWGSSRRRRLGLPGRARFFPSTFTTHSVSPLRHHVQQQASTPATSGSYTPNHCEQQTKFIDLLTDTSSTQTTTSASSVGDAVKQQQLINARVDDHFSQRFGGSGRNGVITAQSSTKQQHSVGASVGNGNQRSESNSSKHNLSVRQNGLRFPNWDFIGGGGDPMSSRLGTPPNVKLLRDINQRARLAERSLLLLKVVGFVQLLVGLVLVCLDWARLLLVWVALVGGTRQRVWLALRLAYPAFVVFVGAVTMAAGLLNRRAVTQLALVVLLAWQTPHWILPTETPVAHSLGDAILISDLKSRESSDSMTATAEQLIGDAGARWNTRRISISTQSPSVFATQQSPGTNDGTKLDNAQPNTGVYYLKLSSGNLTTVQQILIAFVAVAVFGLLLALASSVICMRLLRVQ